MCSYTWRRIYWRLAISDSNIEDYSNGWLYAHLIENTIAVDVGDTVEQFDYLGDIIEWTSRMGSYSFCRNKRYRICLAIQ
jgi:hypothetical protein